MRYKVEYKVVGPASTTHIYRILELKRPLESDATEALLRSGAISSGMVSRVEIKSITPA